MKHITGISLVALLAIGSVAQAAPQVCHGEDRQSGEIYRLQVTEMGLLEGTLIRTVAFKDGRRVSGLYEVVSRTQTGVGTYVNLKFVSGDMDRSYQFLIGIGKTFLVTDNGYAQLFCE